MIALRSLRLSAFAVLTFAISATGISRAQSVARPVPVQLASPTQPVPVPVQQTWRFDNLSSLGGHPVKVLGTPQLIDTPIGKAVAFNGVDSALFVNVHPLAGATTWTWEMIFKPDADGKPEQRIFHLQSVDPATGQDIADERMLFEIRVHAGIDGKPAGWCLDSFATAGGQ